MKLGRSAAVRASQGSSDHRAGPDYAVRPRGALRNPANFAMAISLGAVFTFVGRQAGRDHVVIQRRKRPQPALPLIGSPPDDRFIPFVIRGPSVSIREPYAQSFRRQRSGATTDCD
jgi:hypothetical protein